MIKSYEFNIALPFDDTIKTLIDSGNTISDWKLLNYDANNSRLDWKQGGLSTFGFARISSNIISINNQKTKIIISVHRLFQIFDPFNICYKTHLKLKNRINEKLESMDLPLI